MATVLFVLSSCLVLCCAKSNCVDQKQLTIWLWARSSLWNDVIKVLQNPANLKALFVNSCEIQTMDKDALDGLSSLEIFSAYQNNVLTLDVEFLLHTPNMVDFSMAMNTELFKDNDDKFPVGFSITLHLLSLEYISVFSSQYFWCSSTKLQSSGFWFWALLTMKKSLAFPKDSWSAYWVGALSLFWQPHYIVFCQPVWSQLKASTPIPNPVLQIITDQLLMKWNGSMISCTVSTPCWLLRMVHHLSRWISTTHCPLREWKTLSASNSYLVPFLFAVAVSLEQHWNGRNNTC